MRLLNLYQSFAPISFNVESERFIRIALPKNKMFHVKHQQAFAHQNVSRETSYALFKKATHNYDYGPVITSQI